MSLKYILLILFAPLLLLQSCNNQQQSALPTATGNEFQILVVTDEFFPGEEYREEVKDAFFVEYPALPAPESWFNLEFVAIGNFSMIHQRNTHIIFLSPNGDKGRVATYMRKAFSEEAINRMFASPDSIYLKRNDVWANSQLVVYLGANSMEELLSSINSKKENILASFDQVEHRRIRSRVFSQRGSTDIIDLANTSVRIPLEFRKAIHKEETQNDILNMLNLNRFSWYRLETNKTGSSILAYSQPYTSQDQFSPEYIMNLRDSVTKQFIPGPSLTSYMTIERQFEPENRVVSYHGNYAIETRGLWKLEGGDFMGGPFLQYTIYDEKNQQIVTLGGFVFAPETSKKNLVKRLEIILSAK